MAAVVQDLLSAIPAGCTWLLPVTAENGEVVDFRIAAVGGQRQDIYRRGTRRVNARLSEIYPSMVGGPLWKLYHQVLSNGVPGRLPNFQYDEKRIGVVAKSLFDVTVQRVLGGLLIWWERLDEGMRRLEKIELLGALGWAEYDLPTGHMEWSPGMYRIFERDPALGPMSRAEQSAALIADDDGLRETIWQTWDSGVASDVTVRFQPGDSMKYVRILSDVARDSDGTPLKISAVMQDITVRQDTRIAIEHLSDQLRSGRSVRSPNNGWPRSCGT